VVELNPELNKIYETGEYRIWQRSKKPGKKSKLIFEVWEKANRYSRLPFEPYFFDTVCFTQKNPESSNLLTECIRILREGGNFYWAELSSLGIKRGLAILKECGLEQLSKQKRGDGSLFIVGYKPLQNSRH